MGWNPYTIDLETERRALTSPAAARIDSVAWAVILLVMWTIAFFTS